MLIKVISKERVIVIEKKERIVSKRDYMMLIGRKTLFQKKIAIVC